MEALIGREEGRICAKRDTPSGPGMRKIRTLVCRDSGASKREDD